MFSIFSAQSDKFLIEFRLKKIAPSAARPRRSRPRSASGSRTAVLVERRRTDDYELTEVGAEIANCGAPMLSNVAATLRMH